VAVLWAVPVSSVVDVFLSPYDGDYRGHDMDHSRARKMQVNSEKNRERAMERSWRQGAIAVGGSRCQNLTHNRAHEMKEGAARIRFDRDTIGYLCRPNTSSRCSSQSATNSTAQLKRSRVPSKDVAGFEESVHCCARADYHARKEAQKRKIRRCAQGPIPTYEGVLGE
jgi:hypothetical protein